jgi:hypothetical protein
MSDIEFTTIDKAIKELHEYYYENKNLIYKELLIIDK